MSAPHGVLVVDKPAGKTSHDIVAAARRSFATRAVGHAGTLDPMATGVLLLLFGEATKLSSFLTADDKQYRAVVSFGRSTDTLDAEGGTVEQRDLAPGWLVPSALDRALELERARTEQVPPSFSAIKVGGKTAHSLSRKGEAPKLEPRAVSVRSLELESADDRSLSLLLTVSKGYFVRSLASDLCASLGVPGHLSSLRRLRSGAFGIDEAASFPLEPRELLSVSDAARRCLPCIELVADAVQRARQGKALSPSDFVTTPRGEAPCAWLSPEGELVAIGACVAPEVYRVVRGFVPTSS